MSTNPEVAALAAVLDPDAFNDDVPKSRADAAVLQWAARRHVATKMAERAIAAGYVHLVSHLNGLSAMERLELGDALCREAAEMDEEGGND